MAKISAKVSIPAVIGGGSLVHEFLPDDSVSIIKLALLKRLKLERGSKYKDEKLFLPKEFGLGIEKKGNLETLLSDSQSLGQKDTAGGALELTLVYMDHLEKERGKAKSRWRMNDSEKEEDAKTKSTRQKIASELVETEKTFVKGLDTLNNLYIQPLRTSAGDKKAKIIGDAEILVLFSNIEKIAELNRKFCQDLEAKVGAWTAQKQVLGDLFLKFAPSFKMYSTYVGNHEEATQLLTKLLATNQKFQTFCQQVSADPRSSGMQLSSLLITPIQRIPRYKLLLQELLRNTAPSHEDYADLHKAVQLVNDAAIHVNEELKAQEARAAIREVEDLFDPKLDVFANNRQRRLVKQGKLNLTHVNGKKEDLKATAGAASLFLFSDALVLAQEKGLVGRKLTQCDWINLSSAVTVSKRDLSGGFSVELNNDKIPRGYVFTCPDNDFSEWHSTIETTINRHEGHNELHQAAIRHNEFTKEKGEEGCQVCESKFSMIRRRHHCRACNRAVCDGCSKACQRPFPKSKDPKRVCDLCKHQIRFDLIGVAMQSSTFSKVAMYSFKVRVFPEYSVQGLNDPLRIETDGKGPVLDPIDHWVEVQRSVKDVESWQQKAMKNRTGPAVEALTKAGIEDLCLPPPKPLQIGTDVKVDPKQAEIFSLYLNTVANSRDFELLDQIADFFGVPVSHWREFSTADIAAAKASSRPGTSAATAPQKKSVRPATTKDSLQSKEIQ